VVPADEGIRERKKRLTRQLISDAATALFLSHGFDAVRVADIARECDVAEKTVYNYFPTKESLLLDREQEMADAIRQALGPSARKPPIGAAVQALSDQLDGILASVPAGRRGVSALRRFTELLESTQSLRAAQREMDTRLVQVAAQAMAARGGLSSEEPEVQMAAHAVVGLWRIQFAALRRHTAAGVAVADGLHGKVMAEVTRAARLIESGLWTFSAALTAPGDREHLHAAESGAQRSARQVSAALRRAATAHRALK
jgi:AcrR family transcriptional regulator